MRVSITKTKNFINDYVAKLGFNEEDQRGIVQNLIEAELAEKKSHGLVSLIPLGKEVSLGKVSTKHKNIKFSYTNDHVLMVDGRAKTGYSVVFQALEASLSKVKTAKIICVGIENFGYSSGYIGHYARICAEQDFIFIAFNKSPGGLIPHGAKKSFWGTNPLTIGIPSVQAPVVLDIASSSITWGNLVLASVLKQNIPSDSALDSLGRPTTDPVLAQNGGLLPITSHKGSGLAFIIELLAYSLVTHPKNYSKNSVRWGCLYFLIDPEIFLNINTFKKRVQKNINDLKKLPKARGFTQIFFPGEKALISRSNNLRKGYLEIPDQLWKHLNSCFQDLKNPL
jgi:LDH2 family malate/lactate/ureidoglycolate dehydrogenase